MLDKINLKQMKTNFIVNHFIRVIHEKPLHNRRLGIYSMPGRNQKIPHRYFVIS